MSDVYAQTPDGTYLQFPDGTDPSVIQRAVKTHLSKASPAPDPAASIAQGIAGGDQGAAASALTFAPPMTDRKAIDKFRLDYFNTDNPAANKPKATAVALAANPNDYDALTRLSQMSPVAQAAIQEHAQEIKAENDRTQQYIHSFDNGASPLQMAESLHSIAGGGGFVNPVQQKAYEAQQIPGFDPSAAFKGPEGARQGKMTGHGKLDPSLNVLADFAGFSATPQGAAAGLALGEIAAMGTAGKAIAAGSGFAMGEGDAIQRYKAGDLQGAITSAVLGAIPLVAEGMHVKSEVKATRKAAAAIPAVTDIGDIGATRGAVKEKANGTLLPERPRAEPVAGAPSEGSVKAVPGVVKPPVPEALPVSAPATISSRDSTSASSSITPEQVTAASKDGFTKAIDLFAEAKKTNPKLTKTEFAQQLYEFHKEHAQDGGTHNYEGPTGNAKAADVFTAKDASGKPIRYFGFSEKGSAPENQSSPSSDVTPSNGTKLAKANMNADRVRYGLPEIPETQPGSRAKAYEDAYNNAQHEQAVSIAEDVLKKNRPMTIEEAAGNSLKQHQIKQDIDTRVQQIQDGVAAGRDTTDLQSQYDSLLTDLDTLHRAVKMGSTINSHALAFNQQMLDDYTHGTLMQKLKMARPEVAPTAKEVKAITDIGIEHKATEAAIEEHAAQTPDEADSQAAGQKVVEQIQAEQKKQSRRTQRASSKADLDAEFEDLKKQWVKKSTGQLNAGIPIDPEGLRILRDMAKNRVKAGALTVSEVVDHLHEAVTQTLPDATKRQVRDWWTGHGQGSKIPAATTLGDLREQARWMSKIEDVNAPLPKSAPRAVSEAVAKLREEYKAKQAEAKAAGQEAKSPEEIEQARVEKRIESLKKTLEGNVEATPRLTTVDTEQMSGMRKELKSLQEDLAARKKKAGPSPPSPEQLTQVRMQRRIDLIEEKIKSGKVLPEKKAQLSTVDTESMAATRKQLEVAETRLKELQKAARPATAKADPLEAYRTKLNDQIADMQKNIDAGTPENIKKATVQKRAYDEQTTNLIEQRNRLRKQAEAIIESRKTKSRLEKFAQYHRFVILTRASTLGKLGAAATERLIFDPIEDAAGGALSVVPGYRKLSNMAPNGRGSLKATGKAISTAFSRQAIREARQKLQTGMNSIDARLGDPRDHLEQPAIHNLPGRIHGAIKTPIQLAAYEKSIVKQSAWAERNGFDLTKPDVKAAVEARAYLESKRAILMQENTATSIYRFIENGLEKNEKLGKSGKLMASAMRTAFPIVAVPTNFVGEVGLHALGGFRAAWEIAAAKGVENLDHAQADIVVRSLKKQSVGAALFAIGYYNANNFGGYYAKGGNKHNDLETGSVKVNLFGADHEIPHVFLHSPQMEVMTMGAAFRQAMDNWREGKSSETRIGDSAGSVAKGLAEQVPFVDMPQRFFRASESPKATSVFAGQTVGGALVPGLLPDVASGLDKDSRGRTKKRTSQGFMDAIKMSVGARQSVPESRR